MTFEQVKYGKSKTVLPGNRYVIRASLQGQWRNILYFRTESICRHACSLLNQQARRTEKTIHPKFKWAKMTSQAIGATFKSKSNKLK